MLDEQLLELITATCEMLSLKDPVKGFIAGLFTDY